MVRRNDRVDYVLRIGQQAAWRVFSHSGIWIQDLLSPFTLYGLLSSSHFREGLLISDSGSPGLALCSHQPIPGTG